MTTFECPCQWPFVPIVAKWNHTVMQADDFVSEWQASWGALLSFFDETSEAWQRLHSSLPFPRRDASLQLSQKEDGRKVSFCESVELLFHDYHNEATLVIPHEVLHSWDDKPWRYMDSSPGSRGEVPQYTSASMDGVLLANYESDTSDHNWIQDLWENVFEPQAEPFVLFEPPTIELQTWYVDDGNFQCCEMFRIARLDDNYQLWFHKLRELWRDRIDPAAWVDVKIVHPEPPRDMLERHQAHLILSQITGTKQACLVSALRETYAEKKLWRSAFALDAFVTLQDVHALLPVHWPSQLEEYSGLLPREVLTERHARVHHGDGIILYHHRPFDRRVALDPRSHRIEEERAQQFAPPTFADLQAYVRNYRGAADHFDEFTLMSGQAVPAHPPDEAVADNPDAVQQHNDHDQDLPNDDDGDSAESDAEPHYSVVIYSLQDPPATGRVEWSSFERLQRSIAGLLGISRHDLQAFWHVAVAPMDLEAPSTHAFVALRYWNLLPGSTHQLVLLDVEFHTHRPEGQPEVVREARLLPKYLTKAQLLSILGLTQYCDQVAPQKCLAWHNGIIWPSQFTGHLTLGHGDYVRVALPPDHRVDSCISTRTLAGHCHYGDSFNDVMIWHELGMLDQERGEALPLLAVPESEQVILMQRPIERPNPGPAFADVEYLCSTAAYEFDPMQDWRNALYEARKAFLLENPTTVPYVKTWYLDHERVHRMDQARSVVLSPDFSHWWKSLRDTWVDWILPTHLVQINLVQPMPPSVTQGNVSPCAHLILTQQRDSNKSSVVLAIQDLDLDAGPPQEVAVVVPGITFPDAVFEAAGFHLRCRDWAEDLICTLIYHGNPCRETQVVIFDMGQFFVVQRRRRLASPAKLDDLQEDDAIELLQCSLHTAFDSVAVQLQVGAFANWLQVCKVDDEFTFGSMPDFQNLRHLEEITPEIDSVLVDIPLVDPPVRNPPAMPVLPDVFQEIARLIHFDQETANLQPDMTWSLHTWFLDHGRFQICEQPRLCTLGTNPMTWMASLCSTWIDLYDPAIALHVHTVFPSPLRFRFATERQVHLILEQSPVGHQRSILLSGYDVTKPHHGIAYRAHVVPSLITRDIVAFAVGIHPRCFPLDAQACRVWHGDRELHPRDVRPVVSGMNFFAQISDFDSLHSAMDLSAEVSFIQKRAVLLSLSDSFPAEPSTPDENTVYEPQIVTLISGGPDFQELPPFIEIIGAWNATTVERELQSWGHQCHALPFGSHDKVLCLSKDYAPDDWFHYMYANKDITDSAGTFIHSSKVALDTKAHMRFLCSVGYPKAVVREIQPQKLGFALVSFEVSVGVVDFQTPVTKLQKPWPLPHTTPVSSQTSIDLLQENISSARGSCLLTLDFEVSETIDLLQSSLGLLETSFDGLDLPEVCLDAFQYCEHSSVDDPSLDRLLIYTDGSSVGGHSRLAMPDRPGDEFPLIDTWSFLVVGERYLPTGTQSKFVLIGWMAQQVLYNPDSPHHLGAEFLGSDVAEREALCFAALWRLGVPRRIPTVFRPDSLSTCLQAQGHCGERNHGVAFRALRGLFQTLSAILPDDALQVSHVVSHAGDPFNEFVDFSAKQERIKSFYHDRQPVNVVQWLPTLSFMWMLFDSKAGLPPLSTEGFVAAAPSIPPPTPLLDLNARTDEQLRTTKVVFDLQIATANVGSLSTGPAGHGGKLDYLRAQFKSHRLHWLGIQESRSQACSSHVDGVFRLSSGSDRGHFGTELWVNTVLPFAWDEGKALRFRSSDFTVVHGAPRVLLVRVTHSHLRTWILVAHGPQSGRSVSEREQWWIDLGSLVEEHCSNDSLVVLVDANASAGPCDGTLVFSHSAPTASTPFFVDFLRQFQLCLPSTSSCHKGPHDTWWSPDGLLTKRIDYICVPVTWFHACSLSRVVSSLDLGHAFDHQAVFLQLCWTDSLVSSGHQQTQTRGSLDRAKILQQCLDTPLAVLSIPDWRCDIGTHVDVHNAQISQVLQTHCLATGSAPKKEFITQELWDLRKTKLHAKKITHRIGRQLRLNFLRHCFQAWQQGHCEESIVCNVYVQGLLCSRLKWNAKLMQAAHCLRRALKTAKFDSLKRCIAALPEKAPASSILHKVKQFYGSTNLQKLKQKALPLVKDADGQICTTPESCLDRWISFFQQMEGGQRVTYPEQHAIWRQNLAALAQDTFQEKLSNLPTLTDLEIAMRRVALNKATGLDQIPGELCHGHAPILARQVYSQLLKLAIHGHESLVHKGGRLTTLWKGKGDPSLCSSYRSILVSSHLGKTIHRTLRSHQQSLYETFLHRQQIGGKRKIPVTLGLHMLRGYLRWQRVQHRSAGVLFLDLREAFYRVVRPFVVHTVMSDEEIAAMVARLCLPPSVVTELRALLAEPNAAQTANLPWYVQKYITALHQDTHFSFNAQKDACRTNIGSRPGDSFADVVFGYVFARVLHALESEMHQAQLLDVIPAACEFQPFREHVPDDQTTPFLGPAWMDDLAVCISDSTAAGLESKMGQAASLLLETCLRYGMSPNTDKGKTEILFAFVGHGSRALRLKYHSDSHGRSLPVICEHGVHHIAVVQDYVHLGGMAHMTGQSTREMRRRIAIGQQAFNGHRRLLFQNRDLSMEKRCQLFDTLVMSKILFGTEVWVLHTKSALQSFRSSIMRLYRRLLRLVPDAHRTDEDILTELALPAPEELLRRQRLRYLVTLFACSDTTPWGLFQADSAWMTLIQADLIWLYEQLQHSSSLPDPRINLHYWRHIWVSHGKYWKKLVNRACRHAVAQRRNHAQVLQFHRRLYSVCAAASPVHPLVHEDAQRPATDIFGCFQCGLTFRNKAGERAHMFRSHRQVAHVRTLFDSTSCPHCLKEFHSHARVKAHLTYSHDCAQQLRNRRVSCTPAPGAGSTVDAVLATSSQGSLPVQSGLGPQLEPSHLPAPLLVDWPVWDFIVQAWFDESLSSSAVDDRIRAFATTCALSWTAWVHTVASLGEHIFAQDEFPFLHCRDVVQATLEQLIDPHTWDFLQIQEENPYDSLSHVTLEEFNKWCLVSAECGGPWYDPPSIPRCFGRVRVLLHAYSGRRRPGDVQDFLDRATQGQDAYVLLTVSLDLVINAEWGDISRSSTRDFWIGAARDGLVIGFLCGPPCNTWSRARGKQIASHDQQCRLGPRPVRSVDALWGLPSLTLREMGAVDMGNMLLLFALDMLLMLFLSGGFGLLEHPAEPEDGPAIWKLPAVQFLLGLDGFERIRLLQGLFGATSAKPTELLCLHLPKATSIFHAWRVTVEPPKGGNIGHDGREFRTAHLKEYPPSFCGAVAEIFQSALERIDVHPGHDLPGHFLEICRSMCCTDFGTCIGLDYAK